MSEQEQKVFLASGRLISLIQAASFAPYSVEYLGLLARKQKLPAIKIGRDWLTTREAVLAYLKTQKEKHKKFLWELEHWEKQAAAQPLGFRSFEAQPKTERRAAEEEVV